MHLIETSLEIQFSQDREQWHAGPAQGSDLFFRTRAVIDGTPTQWKVYCLPACFTGVPVYNVWRMLKEMPEPPMTAEEYDEMKADTEIIRSIVEMYDGHAR